MQVHVSDTESDSAVVNFCQQFVFRLNVEKRKIARGLLKTICVPKVSILNVQLGLRTLGAKTRQAHGNDR